MEIDWGSLTDVLLDTAVVGTVVGAPLTEECRNEEDVLGGTGDILGDTPGDGLLVFP